MGCRHDRLQHGARPGDKASPRCVVARCSTAAAVFTVCGMNLQANGPKHMVSSRPYSAKHEALTRWMVKSGLKVLLGRPGVKDETEACLLA